MKTNFKTKQKQLKQKLEIMSSYHLFNSIEREENYKLMEDTLTSINKVIEGLEEIKNFYLNVSDEITFKDCEEMGEWKNINLLSDSFSDAKNNLSECNYKILERAKLNQQSYDEAKRVGVKQYLIDNM